MKRYFFFWLLLCYSTILFSQNQARIDSLQAIIAGPVHDTLRSGILNYLSREYRSSDPAKAVEYLQDAIKYARKGGNKKLEANAHLNMGSLYYAKPDYKTAAEYYGNALKIYEELGSPSDIARFNVNVGICYERMGSFDVCNEKYRKALKIREEQKDKKEIGNCYNYIANNYYRKGDYPSAFENYINALKMREEIDDKVGMANCFVGIGIVLKQQNELRKALEYYRKGLQVFEQIKDDNGIGMALNNIGTIQSNLKDYAGAIATHQRSLSIKEKLGDKGSIGFSYYNIGNCYLQMEKYAEARDYHMKSLAIRETLKDKIDISNSYYEMGEVNEKTKNYDEAVSFYNRSLAMAKEIGYEEGIRTAYGGLSSVHKQRNDVTKAFEFYKLYTAEKDSTLNVDNKRVIAELQTRYETEKKEQQIILLNTEKELQQAALKEKELEVRNSRIVTASMGGAIILFILLGYLFYNRTQLKQQALHEKEKLELKKAQIDAVIGAQEEERKRFAQELHDGIGSMMAVVKMNMSHLEPEANSEKASVYHNTISLMDETYRELRNVSHNLMPQALINRGLIDALHDFKDRVNKSGSMRVILEAIAMNQRLRPEVEVSLYRVVQEIITNIIKYSGATNANIQLVNHDKYLSMVIEDDGNGFDPKSVQFTKGNGWHNILTRLDLIRANIDVDSAPQRKGTTILIDVPLAA